MDGQRKLTVFILFLLFFPLFSLSLSAGTSRHYVKHVIDGDTIVLDDGTIVRYLGINTPEIAHGENPAEPYGKRAADFNRLLVGNKLVTLTTGQEEHDRYGRLLAWVYLPDKSLVNEILVRKGLAHVCFYKKGDPVRPLILKAQQEAIRKRSGIWSLPVKNQEKYYIGNSKSYILHRPSCPYGKRTSKRNRVIFKNRLDAYKKGYCRCKICQP